MIDVELEFAEFVVALVASELIELDEIEPLVRAHARPRALTIGDAFAGLSRFAGWAAAFADAVLAPIARVVREEMTEALLALDEEDTDV